MKKDIIRETHLQAIPIIKNINLLNICSWPKEIEQNFLKNIHSGTNKLLKFEYEKIDCSEDKAALRALLRPLSTEEPTHVYTRKTLESYITAMEMSESMGDIRFQELSIEVFGIPSRMLFGCHFSHLESAKQLLSIYKEFDHTYLKESEVCFSSKSLMNFMEAESKKVLKEDSPEFMEDEDMISKAAAGKSRVRLRSGTCFNEYDFNQLLVHEVMTHSLTAINGSFQTNLPLLERGSPRTTKTQEGLATFAEIITGNMDLMRLRRLALRVIAIDMALQGANFYEVFDFFVASGQNDKESFLSASRIFRGGYPEGGIVFTKDNVYLEGLFRVHSFFLWALKTTNLDCIHLLFSGRLNMNDIFLLRDTYKQGIILPPKYLPEWYTKINLLAGKLAYSLVLDKIQMSEVENYFLTQQAD